MRVAKAISILLIGPLLGILVAFVLAVLALPPDPNFVKNGGHASPGDGMLIILYVITGLAVSVPLSVFLAGIYWLRSGASRKIPAA